MQRQQFNFISETQSIYTILSVIEAENRQVIEKRQLNKFTFTKEATKNMMKESNNYNFDNISYSPLDLDNEMDVHNSERVENSNDDGEDEFSTYFTDQKVTIPEADKVN